MIKSPDELKDVFFTAAVLENLMACSQECLDDTIYKVDLHEWCMDLQKADIVSNGEKLYATVEDSDEWGTYNKVACALGMNPDDGDDWEETDTPILFYLAALYFSAHENTRKYLFDEVHSYPENNWNMYYSECEFDEERVAFCKNWEFKSFS